MHNKFSITQYGQFFIHTKMGHAPKPTNISAVDYTNFLSTTEKSRCGPSVLGMAYTAKYTERNRKIIGLDLCSYVSKSGHIDPHRLVNYKHQHTIPKILECRYYSSYSNT